MPRIFDNTGDPLIQKLQRLAVDLSEEENIMLVDVTRRTRQAFDVDRITKRFYDRFKTERTAFLKFIKGITATGDREWYASLMLNRLMFIYFIQKQGFLDGDLDYLRNRLRQLQERKGKDKFLSFYRYFLVRLFHEGLNQPPAQRAIDLDTLLGKVPCMNGGLFDVHELEQTNSDIQIGDDAFEKLFDFFDAYQWHLDERPLRADNEINPDVLGYIFEKYINQKQLGAYYTKEDITGYIARNTVIPFLFDAAEKKCAIAFKPESAVWRLLRDNPDRYIYPAVRKGVDLPLPPAVVAGVQDYSKRTGWNVTTTPEYGLPTETWREYIARRQRCHDLRARLKTGEIHAINDLVTCNLDICQFAEDAIESCEVPELLRAVYRAIETVSVLDPTCGSGAFLFAALNILEPLYDACLERMQAFVEELDRSQEKHHPEKFSDFRKVLADVARHPNRRYFILKSIIINNLYGVDIMEEAVEICKLRLFLKLVAQVETARDIEPLPDIDFNIRPGNTLVGFASMEEVKQSMKGDMIKLQLDLPRLQETAEIASRAFQMFRQMQTEHGMDARQFTAAKVELRTRLDSLRQELDRYLAGQYGIDADSKPKVFAQWQESHQPFHWFAQFYAIMSSSGFDVIIGNPPYVEYRLVRENYKIPPRHFESESTGNLYCFCMERSGRLAQQGARFGMIVPSSLLGLDEAVPLRTYLMHRFGCNWFSTYSIRPSKLFDGVDQRLCIHVAGPADSSSGQIWTTRYHHWSSEERQTLFERLVYYLSFNYSALDRIPQIGSEVAFKILTRLNSNNKNTIKSWYSNGGRQSGFLMHYHRSPRYWIRGMDFEQYFKSPTRQRSVHHFRDIYFDSTNQAKAAGAILNSSLFFFWFLCVCNGRNLTGTDVEQFPVGQPSDSFWKKTGELFDHLMKDYKANSFVRIRKDCEFQEFRPSNSKALIDRIDTVLSAHYELGDEERDFIQNHEIKYRMG